jgi:molecular chaperone GrpE
MESIGAPFDADLQEAITNIPAPTDDLKGKVIDEMEKGYTLKDRVIRFAKVIVGALIIAFNGLWDVWISDLPIAG